MSRSALLAQIALLAGLIGALGCKNKPLAPPRAFANTCAPGDIVYAVDGAGAFFGMSTALRRALNAYKCPINVSTFHWSHGYARVFADQCGISHAKEQGGRLATLLIERRRRYPDGRIFVFAHCAGSAIALAAAEAVPPGTIDRLVMLAPSMSSDYDMRPALRACRDGVDVHCSEHDGYLRCIFFLGTGDRQRFCSIAGRTGFQPIIESEEDKALYAKLHQRRWEESYEWTGHEGGHYGAYQKRYLKAYVLPMFERGESGPVYAKEPGGDTGF